MARRLAIQLPRRRAIVWGLLALALIVRLAVFAATTSYTPVDDPWDYDRIGFSIAQGRGYPDTNVPPTGASAFRPPLYPYFLGAVYAVSGKRVNAARLMQTLLGTLTVALIGLLAWRLWGRRVGLVALAVAAVFPPLITIGAALVSETVFLPLELGAVLAALEYRRRPSQRRWAVLAGVLIGLGALTRSVGIALVLPLAALVLVGRPRLTRSAVAAPALLVIAAVLTIAPWTIRNAIVLHSFVPVSTEDGYTLAGTYNPTSAHDRQFPAAWRPVNLDPETRRIAFAGRPGTEAQVDDKLRSSAIDYATRHPAYVLKVAFHNVVRLFELGGADYSRRSAASIGLGRHMADFGRYGFWLLIPLALAGALTRSARQAPRAIWFAALLMSLGGIFVESFVRLRAPLDPFLLLLASLTLVGLWDRRSRARGVASAALRRIRKPASSPSVR